MDVSTAALADREPQRLLAETSVAAARTATGRGSRNDTTVPWVSSLADSLRFATALPTRRGLRCAAEW